MVQRGMEGMNLFISRLVGLGRESREFIQLKERFDGLIMLVWGQESIFHIAAGSHPVQAAWGSQNRGPKNAFIQPKRYKDKTWWISLPGGYFW